MFNDNSSNWTLAKGLLGGLGSYTSGLSSVKSLRQGAKAAEQAGQFNASVEQFNSTQRLNALARQVQQVLGTQSVQAAGSGFSSTSKSILAIKAATLDELDRQIVEGKASSKLAQQMAIYHGQVEAYKIRQQAQTQQSANTQQGLTNLFSLGSMFLG